VRSLDDVLLECRDEGCDTAGWRIVQVSPDYVDACVEDGYLPMPDPGLTEARRMADELMATFGPAPARPAAVQGLDEKAGGKKMAGQGWQRISPSARHLWHGSANDLAVGAVLVARPDGYVASAHPALEALFEAERPEAAIPRAEAVYLVAREEHVEAAGGNTDWMARVEVRPGEPLERHDLAWYSAAQGYLEDGDHESAADCARAYWTGDRFHDRSASLFEYLCRSTVVLSVEGPEPDESLAP
jgi:hypothetical protein